MFENLKIRQRLKKAFAIIVVISSIAGVLGAPVFDSFKK